MTAPGSLVTVGLPVYNGEDFVEEALRSILAQDYADLEVLVADNASTDDTLDRCRALAAGDARVRVLTSDRNRGAAWNYNRLLHEASGRYFKWAAADDVCAPGFVRSCVEVLQQEGPDTVIAFPQSELIDESGAVLGAVDDAHLALRSATPHERLDPLLQNRFEWHPVFGVMPTARARTTRGIGSYVLADVVFLVEMALMGRFAQVPETLFLRRYHTERPLVAQPRFKDQAAWFDTDAGGGASFPQVNAAKELLRAIARSSLPGAEKSRCARTATRAYILPHWRHMGGEAKLAIRERAGRA